MSASGVAILENVSRGSLQSHMRIAETRRVDVLYALLEGTKGGEVLVAVFFISNFEVEKGQPFRCSSHSHGMIAPKLRRY